MSKRGRPVACNAKQRRHVASLVRQHTASKTREILAAEKGTELAELRNANLFPEPVTLSVPTLAKYAKQGGVELKRGRRKAA
jgi:hypothetical protein